MRTYMTGKQTDQYTPTALTPGASLDHGDDMAVDRDPEALIRAMERVNVLFDRMREGCPAEARVMSHVLPHFLLDFFPAQDIMNKIIGEFLSSQQPHPGLVAGVIFTVSARVDCVFIGLC